MSTLKKVARVHDGTVVWNYDTGKFEVWSYGKFLRTLTGEELTAIGYR